MINIHINGKKGGAAIALALLVVLGIVLIATFVPSVKQTLLELLTAIF